MTINRTLFAKFSNLSRELSRNTFYFKTRLQSIVDDECVYMHLQHLVTTPTHIVLMYANRTRFNLFTEQLLAVHNLEQLVAIVVRIAFIRLPNLFLQNNCTILMVDLIGWVIIQVACTSSIVLQ